MLPTGRRDGRNGLRLRTAAVRSFGFSGPGLIAALLFLGVGVILPGVLGAEERPAERVVIVANETDAESMELAEYYAGQRSIPEENIIGLRTSREETISIGEYVETVHNPLFDALQEAEWIDGVEARQPDRYGRSRMSVARHSIAHLVLVRGIPLRIRNNPDKLEPSSEELPQQFRVNRGSVDSELALLAGPQSLSMTALIRNPWFGGGGRNSPDRDRVISVARLDGPTAESVRAMIDRTLRAEREGLRGRAYFDLGGPHEKGDKWLGAAAELARKAHFDTEVEESKSRFDHDKRLDAPAIYMGWYRPHSYGPWREPDWSVPPGAIAYHLHSFSAKTVRSTRSAWLGSFVRQGYGAMVGTVYEPYLEFTHRPQLLLGYLLEGKTFGEAVLRSTPALSWQGVAIGDPLYRPFKVGLGEQLDNSGDLSYAAYIYLREMNRLREKGKPGEALSFGLEKFEERPSLPLGFALAKLLAEKGETGEALDKLDIIRYMSSFPKAEMVLAKKAADFLHEKGEGRLALEVYENLNNQVGAAEKLRVLLLEDGAAVARAAGRERLASEWEGELRRLRAPEPGSGGG